MFGNTEEAKFMYIAFGAGLSGTGEPGFASQCVACGACLEKCPQHIAIPDELERVAAAMEGPDFKDRVEVAKAHFTSELH